MHSLETTIYTETAHILRGHPGRCKNLHGHSYKWVITIDSSQLDISGMVIDFSEFKAIANEVIDPYDHAVVLDILSAKEMGDFVNKLDRVIIYTLPPTAENMAKVVHAKIGAILPSGIWIKEVAVYETVNNKASYNG